MYSNSKRVRFLNPAAASWPPSSPDTPHASHAYHPRALKGSDQCLHTCRASVWGLWRWLTHRTSLPTTRSIPRGQVGTQSGPHCPTTAAWCAPTPCASAPAPAPCRSLQQSSSRQSVSIALSTSPSEPRVVLFQVSFAEPHAGAMFYALP